jgi:hypothetical protein
MHPVLTTTDRLTDGRPAKATGSVPVCSRIKLAMDKHQQRRPGQWPSTAVDMHRNIKAGSHSSATILRC